MEASPTNWERQGAQSVVKVQNSHRQNSMQDFVLRKQMDINQNKSIFKGNSNHRSAANYPVEKINDHIQDLKVKKGLI